MAEKTNVPDIRFAGFTDPWEQRKLGDVATITRGERFTAADYVESDGIPCIHYGEIYTDYGTVATKTISQVKPSLRSSLRYAKPGDVIVATTSENVEDVCKAVAWIGNSLVAYHDDSFALTFSGDPVFLVSFFETSGFYAQKSSVAHGVKVMRVSSDSLANINLPTPLVVEQRLIGSYFSCLDFLITLHQRKYDKLAQLKKSMLDKMFPKPGERFPEIRFAGFTDPWEQRKLGDVASSFDYGLNAAATEYDGQNKYLRITDIDDESHEFSKSDLTTPLANLAMSADYLLKEGDLLFARTGASVGKTYLYRQFDGMVYFAGFLIRARISEGADPEFAYQATLTDAYKKYVAITSQRSGQPGVNAQEYADYQLMIPSKTEQQQIGMTLRSLDSLITLHQRKLELLRNTKKSLLDRMFV